MREKDKAPSAIYPFLRRGRGGHEFYRHFIRVENSIIFSLHIFNLLIILFTLHLLQYAMATWYMVQANGFVSLQSRVQMNNAWLRDICSLLEYEATQHWPTPHDPMETKHPIELSGREGASLLAKTPSGITVCRSAIFSRDRLQPKVITRSKPPNLHSTSLQSSSNSTFGHGRESIPIAFLRTNSEKSRDLSSLHASLRRVLEVKLRNMRSLEVAECFAYTSYDSRVLNGSHSQHISLFACS